MIGSTLIKIIDIVAASTEYATNIQTELGRKGQYGSVIASSDNTGIIEFAVNADSPGRPHDIGYSGWMPLKPGQSYSLDHMEIGSLKVKGTVADDIVIIEVH